MTSIKAALRKIKDQQYTEIEVKVRDATSNDAWGASTSLMMEIAKATFDYQEYPRLWAMLWKRMLDYQHVLHVSKALTLCLFLLRHGAQRFIEDCRKTSNAREIARLKKYKHFDANNHDDAGEAREKAKMVYDLLMDDAKLQEERAKAEKLKGKIESVSSDTVAYRMPYNDPPFGGYAPRPPTTSPSPPRDEEESSPSSGAGTGVVKSRFEDFDKPGADPFRRNSGSGVPDAFAEENKEAAAKKKKVVKKKRPSVDGAGAAPAVPGGSAAAAYEAFAQGDPFASSAPAPAPAPSARAPAPDFDLFATPTAAPTAAPVWVDAFAPAKPPTPASAAAASTPSSTAGSWDPFGDSGSITTPTSSATGAAATPTAQPKKEDAKKSSDLWDLGLTNLDNITQTTPAKKPATNSGPSMAQLAGSNAVLSPAIFDSHLLGAPAPQQQGLNAGMANLSLGGQPMMGMGIGMGMQQNYGNPMMMHTGYGGMGMQPQQQQQPQRIDPLMFTVSAAKPAGASGAGASNNSLDFLGL